MRPLPALVYDPDLDTGELANTNLMIRHLFKLVATATYKWTDADQNVYFDGTFWNRIGLDFGSFIFEISGGIPSLSFEIPNVSKWFSDIALGEDLRNKVFKIYRVMLDRNLKVIGYATEADMEPIFSGFIDSIPDTDRETGRVEVVSHRITEKGIGPRRGHSPECEWVFKDTSSKVIGTDTKVYTCIKDHFGHLAANKPITGTNWDDYWELAGAAGATWAANTRYQAGTCRYEGAETWCDHTKVRCQALANFNNFGGDEFISDLADKDVYWCQRVKSFAGKK